MKGTGVLHEVTVDLLFCSVRSMFIVDAMGGWRN